MVSHVSNLEASAWQRQSIALEMRSRILNLVDRMQFGWSPTNAAGHVIPAVLLNGYHNSVNKSNALRFYFTKAQLLDLQRSLLLHNLKILMQYLSFLFFSSENTYLSVGIFFYFVI